MEFLLEENQLFLPIMTALMKPQLSLKKMDIDPIILDTREDSKSLKLPDEAKNLGIQY